MIRRIFICNRMNPSWPIGQYFIVDEDYENCVPGRPVQTGGRGQFHIQPTSQIELPFTQEIRESCLEIGRFEGEENPDGIIVLN